MQKYATEELKNTLKYCWKIKKCKVLEQDLKFDNTYIFDDEA